MRPSERFNSLIQYWAERAALPVDLVTRQVAAESAFNPRAESHCGARGLLQLMPLTAKEVNVADPFNPDECLRGGTEYLARQLANVRLVLAVTPTVSDEDLLRFALCSYNAGFGYVRAALRDILSRGSPPTWASLKASLPHATVRGKKPDHKQAINYVEKILP